MLRTQGLLLSVDRGSFELYENSAHGLPVLQTRASTWRLECRNALQGMKCAGSLRVLSDDAPRA